MKKLLLLIVLFITATLQAQEIKYGFKAGANFSKININNNSDLVESEMKTGFHIGGIVEFKISDRFALEPQILYSKQNSVLEIELVDLTFPTSIPNDPIFVKNLQNDYKLDFINLPILAKFYLIDDFNIFVGPQFCYLISEKDKYGIKEFD